MVLSVYPTSAASMVNPERRRAEELRHDEIVLEEYGPKALKDSSIYTETDINTRIEWVKQRQTHRLTPLSDSFLDRYLRMLKNIAALNYSWSSIPAVQQDEQEVAVDRLLTEIPRYEVE